MDTGLGDDVPGGGDDETSAPELQAITTDGCFVAGTVGGGHETAVGNRVAALDGLPGVVLVFAFSGLFAWMPADGGGNENQFGAGQCGEPGSLGIPLVPADEYANATEPGLPGAKAKVTGCEVEFFVIKRIVGNVHLAVDTEEFAGGVNDGGAVVEKAGGALLEDGGDDDNLMLAGNFLECLSGGTGDGFGMLEVVVIFFLAKVLSGEELLGADDLGATAGGLDGCGECIL